MVIGIPREIMRDEHRVAATPETVGSFLADGYEVLVERGAGRGSYFSDGQYEAAGARLADSAESLYRQSDIVLKVKEPQNRPEHGGHEVDLLHEGQVLIAFLHPASPANHEMVRRLAARGVTSLTLDGIPRISRAQQMDALTSMSTCAGYKGMLMAADHLSRFVPQIFGAAGMIRPAQVLVIGSGVAGLQAIATAKRLGAVVHAADIRPEAAEQAKSLGARIVDLKIPPELAAGKGGYARHLPAAWLEKERAVLTDIVAGMDIVFCSALVPGSQAPLLLTEDMVARLQPGSVVIDVSIDQGGNCALTVPGETVVKHDVTIIGIKNIPGLLPTSATWLFANNVAKLLHYMTDNKTFRIDRQDDIIASALTTCDGRIVHTAALEVMASRGVKAT